MSLKYSPIVTPKNTLVSLAATGMLEVLAMKTAFSASGLPDAGSFNLKKLWRASAISFPLSPQPT